MAGDTEDNAATGGKAVPVAPARNYRLALAEVDPSVVQWQYVRAGIADRVGFALSSIAIPPYRRRGSWDLRCIPIEQHPTYRLLSDYYHAGYEPSATARFQELLAAAERGHPVKKGGRVLATESDIRAHFERYRKLFDSMARLGYQSGMAHDEVNLAVSRSGTWIKVANGNHRFAIAHILGLDRVTTEIRFVHECWWRSGAKADLRQRLTGLPGVMAVHDLSNIERERADANHG